MHLQVEHLHKVHSAGVAWPALSGNCTHLLLRVEHFGHEWSRFNVDTVKGKGTPRRVDGVKDLFIIMKHGSFEFWGGS